MLATFDHEEPENHAARGAGDEGAPVRVEREAQGKVVAQGSLTELRKRREVLDAYLIG